MMWILVEEAGKMCYNYIMRSSATTDFATTTLSFVGDAVFTLFIREQLALLNLKTGELTRRTARIVSAVSQSRLLFGLEDVLTQDEADVVRRCRNTHTNTHAKNATIAEYRRASGLEGLIGHLYLTKSDRLQVILQKCLQQTELFLPKPDSEVSSQN